jgi:hypothetical protein
MVSSTIGTCFVFMCQSFDETMPIAHANRLPKPTVSSINHDAFVFLVAKLLSTNVLLSVCRAICFCRFLSLVCLLTLPPLFLHHTHAHTRTFLLALFTEDKDLANSPAMKKHAANVMNTVGAAVCSTQSNTCAQRRK